jgi:hypothetical protein
MVGTGIAGTNRIDNSVGVTEHGRWQLLSRHGKPHGARCVAVSSVAVHGAGDGCSVLVDDGGDEQLLEQLLSMVLSPMNKSVEFWQ